MTILAKFWYLTNPRNRLRNLRLPLFVHLGVYQTPGYFLPNSAINVNLAVCLGQSSALSETLMFGTDHPDKSSRFQTSLQASIKVISKKS
jgi:hypothetical protein